MNGPGAGPSANVTLNGTYYWIPEVPAQTPKEPNQLRDGPVGLPMGEDRDSMAAQLAALTSGVSQMMKILSGLQGRQEPVSNAVSVDVGERSAARSERSYHPVAADKNSRRVRISEQRQVETDSVSGREGRHPRHVSDLRRDRESRRQSSDGHSSRESGGRRLNHRKEEQRKALMLRRCSLTPRSRYSTSSDSDEEGTSRHRRHWRGDRGSEVGRGVQFVKALQAWKLAFTGESDQMDPGEFLERLQVWREATGVRDEELLTVLPEVFSHTAGRWFRATREKLKSWKQFNQAFRYRFLNRLDEEDLMDELYRRRRRQGEHESISNFLSCFQLIVSAFKHPPSEGKLTRIVFRNLLSEYRRFVALHEVRTLAEMESLGHELERLKDLDARYLPPPPKDKCRVPGSAYLGNVRLARTKNVAIVELVESGTEAASAEVGETATVEGTKQRRGESKPGVAATVPAGRDPPSNARFGNKDQRDHSNERLSRDEGGRYGGSRRNESRREPGACFRCNLIHIHHLPDALSCRFEEIAAFEQVADPWYLKKLEDVTQFLNKFPPSQVS